MLEYELGATDAIERARRDDTGTDTVCIRHDGIALDANGTILPRVLGDAPRRFKLHLSYEKLVMELFINSGLQTVTRVAFPQSSALHLAAGATGDQRLASAAARWSQVVSSNETTERDERNWA